MSVHRTSMFNGFQCILQRLEEREWFWEAGEGTQPRVGDLGRKSGILQWQYILGKTQWLKTWYLLTYWEFWSIGPAAHTLSPKRREIHLPSILLLTSVIYTGWKCSPSVSKWKCENKINPPIKTLVVNPHIVDSLFPWPGDGHSQSQKNKFVLHKLYSSGKYHQKPLLTQGLDFIDSTMSSEVFFFFCC